jgi:hypothetical protein
MQELGMDLQVWPGIACGEVSAAGLFQMRQTKIITPYAILFDESIPD